MKNISQTSDFHGLRQSLRPEAVSCDAEDRCDKAVLSDDDLELVNAAGDTCVPTMNPEVLLGRHARPTDIEERRL